MNAREQQLLARRAALLRASDRLRDELSADGSELVGRLSAVQRISDAGKRLADRPLLIAGAAAFVLFAGPAQALRLAGRALVVAGLVKRLMGFSDPSKP